ncbi:heparin/heparan-sulfate lyase [Haladaptatus litoreus]|uniref:Heparin/heparan-sulfate lyase n=1 Tax=Haladaptatus litoreus TaxID=553468 RepID=A0A1N7DF78_9EURY|nr:heparinase II/III family protein [Haladaptatus litoreus]SIR74471.1 heparin/heparan-sulfate lyase [Haladaptatus litoreus]
MNAENIHQLVREDHPRLFVNQGDWPAVERNIDEKEWDLFKNIKAEVNDLTDVEVKPDDYGVDAAKAALVYRVTGEERYAQLSFELLAESVEYYHDCYQANEPVDWHSHSRIHAWVAYDWTYDTIPVDERKELATSFLKAVEQVQPTEEREQFVGENWSNHQSGFYGTRSLLWYAGLATYGDGVNDDLARHFLTRGYEMYTDLLAYRSSAAGDVGGSASGTVAYTSGDYPWAEFNFFHTLQAATGRDISEKWPYVSLLPGYLFWNWLPGMREFGAGDAHHKSNTIRNPHRIHAHCSHIVHFYGEKCPREAAFAKWLRERLPREFHHNDLRWPLSRFFMTNQYPNLKPEGPPPKLGTARHFPGLGQVFFRSGYGQGDTYASFTTGGSVDSHKHYDHGHFNIFKKGYLALDSGARAYPTNHLTHYYSRTAAHNCILIKMPGEEMPQDYWGGPAPAPKEKAVPVPNDGGQREQLDSKTVAFESRPEYAYAACDATGAYHPEKCDFVLRQFIYLPPDHFVVFDRVRASVPDYQKTWLLHTAAEPRLDGSNFIADHEGGRLLGKTLFPRNASMTAVGGPGNQFMAGGRNWPLGDDFAWPETNPLYGQWRVEVQPDEAARDDHFLHVLHAADQSTETVADMERIEDTDHLGVRIEDGTDSCEVTFGLTEQASGHVTRTKSDETVVDRSLIESVANQENLFN